MKPFPWAALVAAFFILATLAIYLLAPAMGQDPGYHAFADTRTLAGIPHAWNVVSNLPFILFGAWGIGWSWTRAAAMQGRWIFLALFASFVLTGLGSGWYHLGPGNSSLVLDRLPMALTLSAFLALACHIQAGSSGSAAVFGVAVIYGLGSVLFWDHSEKMGAGDVRFYGLFQFGSLLMIGAMLLARPAPGLSKYFWQALAAYVLAKIFESLDLWIFEASGKITGGHALKHILASLACLAALRLMQDMNSKKIPGQG